MMKKSLIALAVMAASGAAFAATSNVDVYGAVRVSLSDTTKGKGWTVNDEGSRIGVKGSEDLGGGLSAIWQFESELNAVTGSVETASTSATTDTTLRNTFVGLKSGFGTVLAGNHDTPYKLGGSADVFGDTLADAQKGTSGIIGRNGLDNRANNVIAYISPDYNGFHVAAAGVAQESGATTATTAMSYVLVYANGPLKATLGTEKFNAGQKGTKFNVAYDVSGVKLGYTYEQSKATATQTGNDKAHLVSIAYPMGPITLAAQYGKFMDKDDSVNTAAVSTSTTPAAQVGGDVTRTTVGAIYNLSKRTNVGLVYSMNDATDAAQDKNTTVVQLNHSF